MKLLRFEQDGARLGVLKDDRVIPLATLGLGDWTMTDIITKGEDALGQIAAHAAQADETLALADLRLLAPIDRPGKFMAIGMNYAKHLEEADSLGVPRSAHQVWFNKQTSCISGPFDPIEPGVTEKLDYEVELGAVIGRPAKGVSAADAHHHVFGYVVLNDVSARDWQFHSPTFTMGKSFDTHGPVGPWLVTVDEIPDPHALRLRAYVNGELRQDNVTSNMIANLWEQIAYLSTAFTLESGDLLATGTPEGVGVGMNPPCFLKPGDLVRCEVEGVGTIENRVAG